MHFPVSVRAGERQILRIRVLLHTQFDQLQLSKRRERRLQFTIDCQSPGKQNKSKQTKKVKTNKNQRPFITLFLTSGVHLNVKNQTIH